MHVIETLDALASLTLSQIAERIARLAGAEALALDGYTVREFSEAVSAFARASERAEGSKLTVEGKIEFLASIPDAELDAAIAETERIINAARSGRGKVK